MKQKKRPLLQLLLAQYGGKYTKDQLTAFVACKNVYANGELSTDPRKLFSEDSSLALSFEQYVSRGGYKLEHALDEFSLSVEGLVMLDAGSSTGGFTDCLLQRGAKLVHSVDVGSNQLDWRLRTDRRVLVHEKQNIMTVEALDPTPQAAVCDLSFRSIGEAASHILSLSGSSWLVALIKPQFEVPKDLQDFTGVITDNELLVEVMNTVFTFLSKEGVGFHALALSPLTGHKGNREFLALLKLSEGMDSASFTGRLEELLALPQ
ncbi:MAG: TlyA family RNA methyltransferase [Spirochaetia bacterium]|jgi:23S rRNA (cytidine1920-2'-O)/16S rRNA (cytidine1409-2'-O)-methyltransferase|nr:TlyA family RNA methyltransferase [Spirochaetia bacterium]